MAEFRLTPAARRDLEAIWRYSAEHWGVDQAALYLDALNAGFEALAEAPLAAPGCDFIRLGYRRQWVMRHVIYYRIDNARVVVVRVLHARMDASRHL